MQLKRQLQITRRGVLSVTDYIEKMMSIADNLSLVSKHLDEDDLDTPILNGLGSKYDGTIDSIQSRENPISLVDLHGLLLSAKLPHEDNDSIAQLDGTTTALYTSKHGPFKGKNANTHPNRNNSKWR